MHAIAQELSIALDALKESLRSVLREIPALLVAALVVLLFVGIARAARRAIFDVGRLSHIDPMLQQLIVQLFTAAIVAFGVALSLGLIGLNAATIAASFGVAGLIVGFALKDILENFIAGVMILWRRPFKVLDYIRVGTNEGVVREITFRTTTLLAPDGIEILVPNAQLFTQAVFNYTGTGSRRTTVVLTVSPDTDLDQARRIIRETAERVPGVLTPPPAEVLLLGASPDAFELHLRYWTVPDIRTVQAVESAVRRAEVDAIATLTRPEEVMSAAATPDRAPDDGSRE